METESLMKVREVARVLAISDGTLYHRISQGKGPKWVRISARCVRWRRCDVEAWIAERGEKWERRERGPVAGMADVR
jgi:predicted DNA-binding transcriptional regulator AlpA